MMNRCAELLSLLLCLTLLLTNLGCGQQQQDEETTPPENQSQAADDVKHARQLWTQIKGYTDWPVPQNFQGWQDGKSPHGSVLKYYINDTAQQSLTQNGAVIVKENYSEKSDDALMSVTIMEKRQGYDPETEDWFYVKYDPDGKIMDNPQGMKLAGLIGKGSDKGCIPCHQNAAAGDYLFMND